jgi:hypothetical protein
MVLGLQPSRKLKITYSFPTAVIIAAEITWLHSAADWSELANAGQFVSVAVYSGVFFY